MSKTRNTVDNALRALRIKGCEHFFPAVPRITSEITMPTTHPIFASLLHRICSLLFFSIMAAVGLSGFQVSNVLNASEPSANAKVPAVDSDKVASELIFPLQQTHNHAPSIVQYPNGDLLVCWYRGSGERTADDVAVMGSWKLAGTSVWSEPRVMADQEGFPDCNTSLYLSDEGKLFLFWPTIIANSWESCITRYKVADEFDPVQGPVWSSEGLVLLKPDDFAAQAETAIKQALASLPMPLPKPLEKELDEAREKMGQKLYQRLGWQPRCKPTVLPSGRMLLPLYTDTFSASIMAVSDDQGKTWFASQPIIGMGNIQPTVLRRQDGTLVAYMRENGMTGKIRVSHSTDDGLSWSPVSSSPLPNPGSGIDGVRLSNGDWLLVFNDTTEGRNRLAISVSTDEGQTWQKPKHLEHAEEGSYHYPAIIEGTDGAVHVVYSYFVGGGKSMKYARIDQAWLRRAVH